MLSKCKLYKHDLTYESMSNYTNKIYETLRNYMYNRFQCVHTKKVMPGRFLDFKNL